MRIERNIPTMLTDADVLDISTAAALSNRSESEILAAIREGRVQHLQRGREILITVRELSRL